MPKKIFILGILIGVLILGACSFKEQSEKPSVKYEEMVQILRDIHIAEGSMQGVTQAVKDSTARVHYAHIFKIHEVTQDDFYKSYDILIADPKVLEKMYEEVKDSIQKKVVFEE